MQEHFRRYLLMNAGIILASFLAFAVVFYLFSKALESKVSVIMASRAVIAQRSADLETLNKLKSDSAAAAAFMGKIEAILPPQDSLIGFPQFVNAMARSHSLSAVFNFDGVPNPAAPPTPGYVDFSVVVEGDAASIRSFVDELEDGATKFMVNLHQVVLTPRADIYHGELKGKVFFQENKSIQT